MSPELSPSLETYLKDWSVTLAIGGAVCLMIGFFVGWIIWRKSRKFTEKVELDNREALSDYERTSEEISRIKAELSGGEQ